MLLTKPALTVRTVPGASHGKRDREKSSRPTPPSLSGLPKAHKSLIFTIYHLISDYYRLGTRVAFKYGEPSGSQPPQEETP